jgi:hypothetical protein
VCDGRWGGFLFGWIDPNGERHAGRLRCDALEASRMGSEGGIERDSALRGESGRSAIVHRIGWHECDTGMTMLSVVPTEELLAMRARILDRPEARREVGSVLQGLELRLGIRIVIRDVGAAVSFRHIEIDKQLRDRFGAHAGAAISVQGEGPRHDILFVDGSSMEQRRQRTLAFFSADWPVSTTQWVASRRVS